MTQNKTLTNNEFEKWYEENAPFYVWNENMRRAWQAATQHSEREIAELKEKLNIELKRVSSYKNLVASLEGQVSHYIQKDYILSKPRLDGLEQSLASEQEMNEVLTNEITELQASNNKLREALEFYAKRNHIQHLALPVTAEKALASTPAQSLTKHDNEVIERIAYEFNDEHDAVRIMNKIRALKGTL